MKFVVIFVAVIFLVACFATQASALPAVGEDSQFVDGVEALKHLEPELHSRHKRATCDLLSAWNVNNSACAAHCLLLGKRGGYCNGKAVCVCR